MTTGHAEAPLGGTALVRLAGVPAQAWELAGNPALFARAAELARLRGEQAAVATALSERLGEEAVPDDRLSTSERRAVLTLRRRLFAGDVLGPDLLAPAPAARLRALHPALDAELAQLAADAATLAGAHGAFARQVSAERDRVGALALDLVRSSAVLRSFVDSVSPRLVPDAERRLAQGAYWSDKPLRKASAALWRAVGRAAMKTTPRGWTGQLCAIPVTESGPADGETGAAGTRTGDGSGIGGEAANGNANANANGNGKESGGANGDGGAGVLLLGATVGDLAAQAVENVHLLAARHAALDPATLPPETPLALTPLYFPTQDMSAVTPMLRCAVVDPAAPTRLRRVTLRRTAALDTVLAALVDGPRTLAETEALLAARTPCEGGQEAARRAAVLRGLLGHLLRLGVLQVCGGPHGRVLPWTGPQGVRAWRRTPRLVPDAAATDTWYVDSYRTSAATVPAEAVARVVRGVRLAARLYALRDRDPHAAPGAHLAGDPAPWEAIPGASLIGEAPSPLGELVAALLPGEEPGETSGAPGTSPASKAPNSPDAAPNGPSPAPASRQQAGWRPAGVPGSGYARLLAHLGAHLDEEHVDIGPGLLDALGAPPAGTALPAWPLDCLLRPLNPPHATEGEGRHAPRSPVAVLESVSPGSMIDARFADALDALYGSYDNVSAYRAFLAAVERETGARFLELLAPPLAVRAANAVRRPVTTSWCTGDPNTALYYGRTVVAETARSAPGAPPDRHGGAREPAVRHVPLHRITLRRVGRSLIAEVDGVRVLPVVHATRTAVPPWDTVQRLLQAAGHPGTGYVIRPGGLAAAFPHAARVPRLTLGGDLVASPAQWRVPRARMWRAEAPEAAKVTALAALRSTYGLPRFCFARSSPDAKPVPVDLAALPTVHLLERLYGAADSDPLLEEALPGPRELLLRDGNPIEGQGAGLAAQLLLRMPTDRAVGDLAAHAAAALGGPTHLPGARAPSARAAGVDTTP